LPRSTTCESITLTGRGSCLTDSASTTGASRSNPDETQDDSANSKEVLPVGIMVGHRAASLNHELLPLRGSNFKRKLRRGKIGRATRAASAAVKKTGTGWSSCFFQRRRMFSPEVLAGGGTNDGWGRRSLPPRAASGPRRARYSRASVREYTCTKRNVCDIVSLT